MTVTARHITAGPFALRATFRSVTARRAPRCLSFCYRVRPVTARPAVNNEDPIHRFYMEKRLSPLIAISTTAVMFFLYRLPRR